MQETLAGEILIEVDHPASFTFFSKVLKVLKEKVEERQSIKGPWVTYIEYPKEELDTLYARFKSNFNYTCSEEVLRTAFNEHVRIEYPEWMSSIRQSVFKEFKTAERYTKGPDHIHVAAWSTMVDIWLSKEWLFLAIQVLGDNWKQFGRFWIKPE
ncbi:hypothetical protein Dsin_013076 [Dipteronia sinensis]|uniref:Uncharacterized protein n=1 Tax=Dipteronia sinensis TaxID=43782 RepID=A0AAE0AJG9_9ROSI|nr:hypothetical protein Dsin_013076 [Dipteronia sinensis]